MVSLFIRISLTAVCYACSFLQCVRMLTPLLLLLFSFAHSVFFYSFVRSVARSLVVFTHSLINCFEPRVSLAHSSSTYTSWNCFRCIYSAYLTLLYLTIFVTFNCCWFLNLQCMMIFSVVFFLRFYFMIFGLLFYFYFAF